MLLTSLLIVAIQTAGGRPDPLTLGPNVGQTLPAFETVDSAGVTRSFESLKGPNGLVLVLFRSADW